MGRRRGRLDVLVIAASGVGFALLVGADPRESSSHVDGPPPLVAEASPGPPGRATRTAADDPEIEISDEDLETFADIYIGLRRIERRYEREMASIDSLDEAQEVQLRMQEDCLRELERHGWTADRFAAFEQELGRRPELAEKAFRLVDERS